MSCEKNSLKCTAAATVAADTLTMATGRVVAPLSNRVVKAVDRPVAIAVDVSLIASLSYMISKANTLYYKDITVRSFSRAKDGQDAILIDTFYSNKEKAWVPATESYLRPDFLKRVMCTAGLSFMMSNKAGKIAVAIASRIPDTNKSKQDRTISSEKDGTITFSSSPLTRYLNRGNSLLSSKHIVSSEGDLISHNKQSLWHRGTTVIQEPNGSKQTITHFQCLAPRKISCYFDRPLSDKTVAALISGRKSPHKLPGYAGVVSDMERLTLWGRVKRNMILARLHWPIKRPQQPEQKSHGRIARIDRKARIWLVLICASKRYPTQIRASR